METDFYKDSHQIKLSGLSFSSIYSTSRSEETNLSYISRKSCYNSVISSISSCEIERTIFYKIVLLKDLEGHKIGYNNNCFLTKNDILSYMKKMSYYCPKNSISEIKISNTNYIYDKQRYNYIVNRVEENTESNSFLLEFSITGSKLIHKFYLTLLRYTYEFPFNMFLIDSLRLKQNYPLFSKYSIVNILSLVSSCYAGDYRDDQCLIRKFIKFTKINDIKRKLKDSINDSKRGIFYNLTQLFDSSLQYNEIELIRDKYTKESEYQYEYQCLDYWRTDFNKRLNNYKSALEFFK